MLIREAADMIRCPIFDNTEEPVTWADLGCGSGVFTQALASLLPPHSTIYAVDKVNTLQLAKQTTTINYFFQQHDFITDDLQLPGLNGILMANALHYVKDKDSLLEKLKAYCKPGASFLVVEYDTDRPVPHWVPCPIKFSLLSDLFSAHGFAPARKLQERASLYGRSNLYSALILEEDKAI